MCSFLLSRTTGTCSDSVFLQGCLFASQKDPTRITHGLIPSKAQNVEIGRTSVLLVTFVFQNVTGYSQTSSLPNEHEDQSLELPSQKHPQTRGLCPHGTCELGTFASVGSRLFIPNHSLVSLLETVSAFLPQSPTCLINVGLDPRLLAPVPTPLATVLSTWPRTGQG